MRIAPAIYVQRSTRRRSANIIGRDANGSEIQGRVLSGADAMLRFHHRPEFVDLLHDGAIAVAADGTIVATDTTGLKLLGAQDRKDLIGCSIADVFDTTYEELVAAAVQCGNCGTIGSAGAITPVWSARINVARGGRSRRQQLQTTSYTLRTMIPPRP